MDGEFEEIREFVDTSLNWWKQQIILKWLVPTCCKNSYTMLNLKPGVLKVGDTKQDARDLKNLLGKKYRQGNIVWALFKK